MATIERIVIRNIKRIEEVDLHPGPGLFEIGGDNGAGKSSILDAIAMALGGKKMEPPEPLRRGAESGVSETKLSDGRTVRRKWRRRKDGTVAPSEVEIIGTDGGLIPKMQTVLDEITGKGFADPVEFLRAKPAEQLDRLRKLVGLDFSTLDARRAALFSERTEVGRRGKEAAGALASMPAEVKVEPLVSIDGLVAEMHAAEAATTAHAAATERKSAAERSVERARQAVAEVAPEGERLRSRAVAEIKRLEDECARMVKRVQDTLSRDLEANANRVGTAQAALEEAEAALAAIEVPSAPPPSDIGARIQAATTANARAEQAARANAARAAKEKETNELRAKYAELTEQIAAIDADKAAQLEAAKFPVAGLGFGDGLVTFNGLPLEQASSAEQLRVSLAMALAQNPKLKVVQIRDGSLLDRKSMEHIARMAIESGCQVFVERVGTVGPGGVVIVDGRVAEAA